MPIWLQRQKYLIDFTLSSLLRRRAKNAGLLLVYTLIVFVLASVMLFTHALRHEAGQVLAGAPEIVLQRMVAGRHDLVPATYLERIGELRGVRSKAGRLWGYFYDPAVRANYTLLVPATDPPAAGEAVIGSGMARARGLAVGDFVTWRGSDGQPRTLRVSRVLDSDSELVSSDLVLVGELLAYDLPVVVALNMIDLAQGRGLTIDGQKLSERLGCPVVPMIARRGDGGGATAAASRRPGAACK